MKKTILFSSLCSLTVVGCATSESYQAKMSRYQAPAEEKYLVPDIKVSGSIFNLKSRGPASVEKVKLDTKEDGKDTGKDELNFTNKKLYFLSLIDQYETLKSFAPEFSAPKINICPNFHTGLLSHYEKNPTPMFKGNVKFIYDFKKISDSDYMTSHPELYLPLTKDAKSPTVADIIKSKNIETNAEVTELVKKALDIHLQKTYQELAELCEYGSSSNYYIYENLITHVKSTNFQATNENMSTLLKSTVFSNMALITAFDNFKEKGRSIASEGKFTAHYTTDIVKKMNVEWTYEYFKKIKN